MQGALKSAGGADQSLVRRKIRQISANRRRFEQGLAINDGCRQLAQWVDFCEFLAVENSRVRNGSVF